MGRWIVSARFDLAIFLFSSAVTLVPWLAVGRFGVAPYYILAAVAIASNGPHLVSTWTRVYMDGRERFRRPLHYYLIPSLIVCGVLAFLLIDGRDSPWLRTVLFYWASWHFMAQCWGLLRIYQRKHGVAGLPIAKVEKALLFGGASWCVLHRIFTGPWTLFAIPIWHPRLPAWFVNLFGAAVLGTAVFYIILRIAEWRRSDKVPELRRPAMIASTVFAFAVPFILIKDGTAAFAAAACWHGIQYLGIVWFYNRNRYQEGIDPRARLMSWVSQKGRWPFYFIVLLVIAALAYLSIKGLSRLTVDTTWDLNTWALFVWTSLTFTHYWLDGVIWKLRKDRTLSARLQAA